MKFPGFRNKDDFYSSLFLIRSFLDEEEWITGLREQNIH